MRWITNLDELGFVDDEDYTLANNTDGSISVTLYTSDAIAALENGSIIVDAIVQLDSGSTTTAGTTKKNDSSKSPGTGIATLPQSQAALLLQVQALQFFQLQERKTLNNIF